MSSWWSRLHWRRGPRRLDPRLPPLLACAALSVLAVVQLVRPADPPAMARPAAPPSLRPGPEAATALASADDAAAILARPLFVPDRRAVAAAASPSGLDGYLVTGIAVAAGAASAVIRPPGGKPLRLVPGAAVDGWTVAAIAVDHLRLVRGEEQRELRLDPRRLRQLAKETDLSKKGPPR